MVCGICHGTCTNRVPLLDLQDNEDDGDSVLDFGNIPLQHYF